MRELIIRLAIRLVFMEGRAEVAGILLERRRHQDEGLLVLQRALAFQKVEELVLDDRPTNAAAVLRALKRL